MIPMRYFVLFFLNLTILGITPLFAQLDFEVGIPPRPGYEQEGSTEPPKIRRDPYAETLATELLATRTTQFWEIVEIATANARSDLAQHLRRGYGRTELISLLLMAEDAQQKLSGLLKSRLEGKRLRDIAAQFKLDYAVLRTRARALHARVLAAALAKIENDPSGKSDPAQSSGTPRGQR
jgi:hypothetical protein